MIVKRINLCELQGKIINRPEMRFLLGGGDPEGAEIECASTGCGVCYSNRMDENKNWVGCETTGNPDDFCVYGK